MKSYPLYRNPYGQASLGLDAVIKLHRFAIADREVQRFTPNLSPFALKVEAYFRFFDIRYETMLDASQDNAPRGKVPFISIDDVRISDSDLILGHLRSSPFDPDEGLSPTQHALGHLVQRTVEDHLYWIILYYEFFDEDGSDFFFNASFGGHPDFTIPIRADFMQRTFDQGIARYTPDEVIEKGSKDLAAIDELLGDRVYLLGTERPTSFDAAVFGLTVGFFQVRGLHPALTDYARSLPNLGRYMRHLLGRYFPELEIAF